MSKFPYAIFDMDGTLLDSMPYWRNLGRDYLISRGKQPEEGLWHKLSVLSTEEAAEYFRERYGLPEDAPSIVRGFNRMMEDNYRLHIPAKAGVAEYLGGLRQGGVRMSICSATSIPLVEMALERLGLRSYFECITSCDEVGMGKDRPDVFLLALKRLGAAPGDAVMYEDADFAVRTAKNLGMYTVGVYDISCQASPQEMEDWCDDYIYDFSRLTYCPQDRGRERTL